MTISRYYIVSAITSFIGSALILLALYVLNNKAINTYSLTIVPVICIIVCWCTTKILLTKYADLLNSVWIVVFVDMNVYLGMAIGIIVGILLVWLLLIPYSLIFGSPEKGGWSAPITHVFELLVLISIVMCTVFCTRYLFISGIKYIKRKKSNQ
jgi:uncharacterized protein YacL